MQQDFDALSGRVDFCDASMDVLKKELRVYLTKKKEIQPSSDSVVTLFKNVAATEPNSSLQKSIFDTADRYTSCRSHLDIYTQCEEQTAMMIDEARDLVVSPLREVLSDTKSAMSRQPNKKNVVGMPLDQYRYNLAHDTLALQAKFFEKHRLRYMKGIFKTLLYSELKYHCRVIEELTPLLALFADTEDRDEAIYFS